MDGLGATTCLSCPTNSNPSVSALADSRCTCNAGASGNGSVCVLCGAGKYKGVSGNSSCVDCGVNTYSGTVGATGAGACVNCPSNSSSAVSSTVIGSCVCNAGATGPNGGVCALCAVGKYKSVTGNGSCIDCGVNTYSGTVGANSSSSCLSCADNSSSVSGSSAVTACTCSTGASGPNGGPCALCVPGKYKDLIGTAACSNCSANTFSSVTGATASSACSNCGDNSQSGGSSAACVCNKGYSGPDGGTCFACVAGTYKTGSGSQACTFCANNTFSGVVGSTNASVCQACQANAISAAGSVGQEYCYCKPGYAHLEGRYGCRDCTPGTYNSQLGRQACSNCTIGMYSLNYTAISPETCKFCPAGQWSPEGSANCNLCPAHSHTLNVSGLITDCVCDPGYIGPGGSTCVACAAGLYKDFTGPEGCTVCPALTSSFPATERATDCWCVSGYIKVAGVCVQMIPRPIQVSGTLEGVTANASAVQIQNATDTLRRSIAAQLNVAIELVQVDRVSNSSNGVQVLLFARSETEFSMLQQKVTLATALPSTTSLPFILLHNSNSSLAEPRVVVIMSSVLFAQQPRRSQQSDVMDLLLEQVSDYFDVSLEVITYNFDSGTMNGIPVVKLSITTTSHDDFVRVLAAANALLSTGNLTLSQAVTLQIITVTDAGPSGLNFTNALLRADGSAMSGTEVQTSLPALKQQLSLYYNVPQSSISLSVITNTPACRTVNATVNCTNNTYSVSVILAPTIAVSLANLQQKYSVASDTLTAPRALVLQLPFALDNVFYYSPSGLSDFYIETELYDLAGAPLSNTQIAQSSDLLSWQLGEFFNLDVSRVHLSLIPARYPMLSNASSMHVSFDCDAAQLSGLLLRASELSSTVAMQVPQRAIAGLANAVQKTVYGQMVDGKFVECKANFIIDALACKCKPGYRLSGAACIPCAAGTYGVTLDTIACTACEVATFSLGGATACTPCHANSNASVGSSSQDACQCSPGFFFLTLLEIGDGAYNTVQNYYCLPCVNGSFKGDEGNWNCSDCSTAYYSSDALSCNTCNAGYARNDTNSSACVSCPKGSFKPAPDASPCRLCAADSFSNVTAALSCESCPAGYRSLSGTVNSTDCCALNSRPVAAPSIQCSCNSGYTGPDSGTSKGQCSACLPGTHKASNGSAYCTNCSIGTYSASVAADSNTTCAMCAAGLYAPQASAKCTVCPANSAAPERSGLITNCLCNTGYTGPNGGSCVACPAGTYKTTNGSAYCTNCSIGTYSTSVAADSNTTCAKCAAGQSSVEGGTNCTACPVGKYNPQAGGPCMVCSENSNSSTGALICTCNADSLGPNGGRCMLKPPLWYRFEVDSELNNSGLAGSTYDLEKLGTTPALDAGVYREGIASARFTAWSDNVDNLYRNKAFWVKNVPLTFTFWFQWTQASYSTMAALVGVTAYRDATNQGIGFDINDPTQGCYAFYGQAPNMWVPSPKGCGIALNTWYHIAYSLTYPGNVIVYLNGIAVNTMTMPTAFPTKVLGRVNIGGVAGFRGFSGYIDDWRVYDRVLTSSEVVQVANIYPYCAPGTYVNASTGTCQNCTPGTYSSIQGSVTCLACPAITNSTTGSPVCHCNPSYTGPNFGPCIACGMGTYKDKANTAPCTACPLNSNSSAGSGNITDCICDALCPGPNGGPCVPKNSTLNVSSGVYQCSPGFTGPDRTGPCVACSVGTYKNVPGSDACSLCAPGQYQDALATTSCSSCAPDTFANASGAPVCTPCPAGYKSLVGTVNSTDCCALNSRPQKQTFDCTNPNLARSCGSTVLDNCPTSANSYYKWLWAGRGLISYLPEYANNGVGIEPDCITFIADEAYGTRQWWQVDLQRTQTIKSLKIWNRDCYMTEKLVNFQIQLSNDGITFTNCATGQNGAMTAPLISTHVCDGSARYLRISIDTTGRLQLGEVEVYGVAPACGLSTILCSCNTGYTGPDTGASKGQCAICPPGTYKATNGTANCTACPLNSNSSAGSGNITDCICDAWCSGPNGGPCVPKNSTLNVSSGVYQCSPGFTGPDRTGPCVACSVGTYKNVPGSVACSLCLPGQYQDSIATTSCWYCAADTFSNASGAPLCTQCPVGYKSLVGTANSTDCCALNSSPQNITCAPGVVNVIASYSTTACAIFIALTPKPSFASISTRNNAAIGTVPTYNAAGGPNGKGHVSFDRTKSQYLDAGSRTFNLASNSGLTMVLVMRFTGSISTWERVLELGILNNFGTNSMLIARTGSGTSLKIEVFNGVGGNRILNVETAQNVIVQNSWLTVVVQYSASTRGYSISVNGAVTNTGTLTTALIDRTLTDNWIARSNNGEAYLNADITGVFVVDEYMGTATTTAISDAMIQGVDLTSAPCEGTAQSCSSGIRCSCNTGYTGPDTGASKGQCAMCAAGTYKASNGSAACTSCPANSNSSVGSMVVTSCSCNPGYTGPNGGPCPACDAGKFKNASGSQACDVCAANTYSASGVLFCTACPFGFTSPNGSTVFSDCCDPNTTYAKNLYDTLSSTTKTALDPNIYRSAYVARVSSAPELKYYTNQPNPPAYISSGGYSGQAFLRFSKTSSTSGHNILYTPGSSFNGGAIGNTVVTVIRFMENIQGVFYGMQSGTTGNFFELYLSDTLQFCVRSQFYNWMSCCTCTDTAVPINVWLQVSYTDNPSAYPRQTLKVTYMSTTGTTIVLSKTTADPGTWGMNDGYKTAIGYSPGCAGTSSSMQMNGACDRPNFDLAGFYLIQTAASDADIAVLLEAIAIGTQFLYDKSSTCQCNAGFSGTGRSNCVSCTPGTYKSEVRSASCSLCVSNTYSTAVQALNVSTCMSCPNNSVSVPGRFECECNFGYEGGMFSCSACVPGKFKRVLGTSACLDCPANMEATGFASVVCASLPGYNGLGYALDDVARSCGASLSGTCTTLSNGATSNAAGGADGGLDGSASTSVSVAFGQNLARSCGNTGTGACATTAGTVFRPWWGVDFAQRRSVFAVSVMSTSWANTKDFKVVVGDVADAQSPLNAVCADYLVGTGTGYVKFTCEDTVNGRYLYIVNGPHAANSLILSDVVVEAFNYAANASLMLPWWAVDFEVERAVSVIVIQAQTASVIQVRVGHSSDPLQNAVCKDNVTIVTTGNNNVNCSSAMLGRYLFVIGTGNKVLVLNDVRVLGFPAAQCAAGTYKPLVGNTNCTACTSLSTSIIGATTVTQCTCRAGYLDVWS